MKDFWKAMIIMIFVLMLFVIIAWVMYQVSDDVVLDGESVPDSSSIGITGLYVPGLVDTTWEGDIHGIMYTSEHSPNDLYFNYRIHEIHHYKNVDDALAGSLIIQHFKALEVYKWYRNARGYSVKKSIRLTNENWQKAL